AAVRGARRHPAAAGRLRQGDARLTGTSRGVGRLVVWLVRATRIGGYLPTPLTHGGLNDSDTTPGSGAERSSAVHGGFGERADAAPAARIWHPVKSRAGQEAQGRRRGGGAEKQLAGGDRASRHGRIARHAATPGQHAVGQ